MSKRVDFEPAESHSGQVDREIVVAVSEDPYRHPRDLLVRTSALARYVLAFESRLSEVEAKVSPPRDVEVLRAMREGRFDPTPAREPQGPEQATTVQQMPDAVVTIESDGSTGRIISSTPARPEGQQPAPGELYVVLDNLMEDGATFNTREAAEHMQRIYNNSYSSLSPHTVHRYVLAPADQQDSERAVPAERALKAIER